MHSIYLTLSRVGKRQGLSLHGYTIFNGPSISRAFFKLTGNMRMLVVSVLAMTSVAHAQKSTDSSPSMTLQQCIKYAMQHQPTFNQTLLGVHIARTTNAVNLSGWLPQVNVSANAIHYFELPTTLNRSDSTTAGTTKGVTLPVHTGVVNTVIPEISATQTIFNPQLLYAAKSAPLYTAQAEQYTDTARIGLVSSVSKSFYNLLQILEQINVLKEDTARLQRNVMDTYHQFLGGIVDESDYDEAVITLNNSMAQLRQQIENVTPAYATLKQSMGYPAEQQFNVLFDTTQMIQDIYFDTLQSLDYERRIEYRILETDRRMQHESLDYYKLAFLPSISAFYNYFYEFEGNSGSGLFSSVYPYSYVGLSLNLPLFTGFSRVENVHKAHLQEDVLVWAQSGLKSQIYTQYTTALASYKGNLYNWNLLKENVSRARNVYRIVSLQYKQGIVAYLNMIVAESNLISAQIGYINALYQLLQSKVDLEKAMGILPVDR